MLKGVNRMVLEVNQPENKYFEKMIFFVKPEFSGMPDKTLLEQAGKAASAAGRPPQSRKRISSGRLRGVIKAALAAAAGAGAMAAAELLIKL